MRLTIGIVDLLGERASLAQAIGHAQRRHQVPARTRSAGAAPREAAMPAPLPAPSLTRLYTEIMSACRALEDAITVAYLGPQGTFSEEAVIRQFGGQALSSRVLR